MFRERRSRVNEAVSALEVEPEINEVISKDPDGLRAYPMEGKQVVLRPMNQFLQAQHPSGLEGSGCGSPDSGERARASHGEPSGSRNGCP
jgi:hypothetical protein